MSSKFINTSTIVIEEILERLGHFQTAKTSDISDVNESLMGARRNEPCTSRYRSNYGSDHYCLISSCLEFHKRTLQEPYARTSHYNVAEMEPLTLGLSSTHISGKSMLRLGTKGLLL